MATRKPATKRTTTRKKASATKTTRTAAKDPMKAYKRAMEEVVSPWMPYPGNKRQLIPVLMEMMPSKADRFIDMFGGTGITGLEAYKNGKCQEVYYNDLEYDMVMLLEWMHSTPADEIKQTYNEARDRWLGDIEELEAFEEDSKEYKEATGDRQGGAHKQLWDAMQDHYNETRIMLWDREEDADIKKIVNAIADKGIRSTLQEFYSTVMGEYPKMPADATEEQKKEIYAEKLRIARGHEREMNSRLQRGKDFGTYDRFAARGDYFEPGELMLILLNTMLNVIKWTNLGRGIRNNPALGSKITPYEKVAPFVDLLQQTPMRFFSNSFTEGWIKKDHARRRTGASERIWRNMISSLTPLDVVFLDPPYSGSGASYNNVYKNTFDIFLFAFCQLLDERGIPWIMTNNYAYQNETFREWIQRYYAYRIKPGTIKLYKTEAAKKAKANDWEVIVTNFKPNDTRAVCKEMLEKISKGSIHAPVDWKTSGERVAKLQDNKTYSWDDTEDLNALRGALFGEPALKGAAASDGTTQAVSWGELPVKYQ